MLGECEGVKGCSVTEGKSGPSENEPPHSAGSAGCGAVWSLEAAKY